MVSSLLKDRLGSRLLACRDPLAKTRNIWEHADIWSGAT